MRKRAKQFVAGTFSAPTRNKGPRQSDANSIYMHSGRSGATLQSATFANATLCKGSKPKLWGFHNPRNAKPGVCIISNNVGRTLRVER